MSASEDSAAGEEAETLPQGKQIPFNSRRLPTAYLLQVGKALELPTKGSKEELRQLIEGKLATDRSVDVSSVQVVVCETPQVATKLWLVDSRGWCCRLPQCKSPSRLRI